MQSTCLFSVKTCSVWMNNILAHLVTIGSGEDLGAERAAVTPGFGLPGAGWRLRGNFQQPLFEAVLPVDCTNHTTSISPSEAAAIVLDYLHPGTRLVFPALVQP